MNQVHGVNWRKYLLRVYLARSSARVTDTAGAYGIRCAINSSKCDHGLVNRFWRAQTAKATATTPITIITGDHS